MTSRNPRTPRRPALFWTVFGLVVLLAVSGVVFLAVYS